MKKTFILLLFSFAFICCTHFTTDDEQLELARENNVCKTGDYQVKGTDILTLSQGQLIGTKSAVQIAHRIECITNNSKDTLLFVDIKQSGGWTIYSSDTRVPAIVAHSDSGSFDKLMEVDGARLWIQSIADEMAIIKHLPDEKLNFTDKEIACNKAFWESISSPDKYVKENLLPGTRAKDNGISPVKGHYEFSYSISYSEVYDSIPRMTTTDWNQSYPYNIYCPLKSNGNYDHAPAGCVAIAGAQMLYFLHDCYGVPSTAPSEAYCNGNIDSYTWDQTNYTTDIWNNMNNSGIYAAPLIANVGKRLGMNYGNDSSNAYTDDLVNNVFAPYGISCTYTAYNTGLLKNSLINGMPVLLSAYSAHTTNTGTENVGHAFIADRYKRTRIVTKMYYEWVWDSNPSNNIPIPLVPEKIEYTYSSPDITMIGINWGWGSYYNVPSEWFSLTGDWISSRCNMSSYNWNIDRHMIYGFQVINN